MGFNYPALYNCKPNYSHLNLDGDKQSDKTDNKILTDLVFPEPGIYTIIVVTNYRTQDGFKDLQKPKLEIESETTDVIITVPENENLEVWKKIKDNKQFTVLMQ